MEREFPCPESKWGERSLLKHTLQEGQALQAAEKGDGRAKKEELSFSVSR